jgi:hypothetical protein
MHHGLPPMVTCQGREYPVQRHSDEFEAFKKSREYKIHSIYDETVLEVDTPTALAKITELVTGGSAPQRDIRTGHDAAVETVRLMYETQQRLPPRVIMETDNPKLGPKTRAKALWKNEMIQEGIVASLADSVRFLADLWTSAWKAGDGTVIGEAELVQFKESDLAGICRYEEMFVPSLSLAAMAESGKFEPA